MTAHETVFVIGVLVCALLLAWPLALLIHRIDCELKMRVYERALSTPRKQRRSARHEYREGEGFTCGTAPDSKVRRIDTAVPRARKATK